MKTTLYGRKSRDERDRVYAICNLLGNQDVSALSPNYSMSAGEVFRRMVVHCLSTSDAAVSTLPITPALLALVGTMGTYATPMTVRPSWVPDLHHLSWRFKRKVDLYFQNPEQITLAATIPFQCNFADEERSRLTIYYLISCGTITDLTPSCLPPGVKRANTFGYSDLDVLVTSLIEWPLSTCR